MASKNDDRRRQSGQGEVKNPEKDRRLKANGGGSHGQGRVKDPARDGRLQANRPQRGAPQR